MIQILLAIHVIIAICLVAVVLVQQGKGADVGAAFGSGASNTIFGSQGSGGFLMKFTTTLAALFFITSLALGYAVSAQYQKAKNQSISLPDNATIPAPTLPLNSEKKQ